MDGRLIARGPDEPGPGRDVRAVRVRGAVRRLDTPAGRQSAMIKLIKYKIIL